MNKQRYPLVLVDWEDAFSSSFWHSQAAVDSEFAAKDSGYMCQQAGWLIRKTKDCIVVAGRANEGQQDYGCLQRIPSGMVKKITTLKHGTDRRSKKTAPRKYPKL